MTAGRMRFMRPPFLRTLMKPALRARSLLFLAFNLARYRADLPDFTDRAMGHLRKRPAAAIPAVSRVKGDKPAHAAQPAAASMIDPPRAPPGSRSRAPAARLRS